MDEKEIFDQNDYESYINFLNNRFCFALGRKCKLYKYDKKIGVRTSIYFDHLDEESFDNLTLCFTNEVNKYLDDEKYVFVNIEALNFDTNTYESVGNYVFICKEKEWKHNEIFLSSQHIGENSNIDINIIYSLRKRKLAKKGFLNKKQYLEIYSSEKKILNLTSILSKEVTQKNEKSKYKNIWNLF